MKLKLFKKYFFATALIIVFSFTVMMTILSFVLNNYLAKSKYETLSKCSVEVTDYLSELDGGDLKTESFIKTIEAISSVSSVDIFLADTKGNIVFCSCDEWIKNGKCSHSEHIIPKNELLDDGGRKSFILDTLEIYDSPHYIASEPVKNSDGTKLGTVFSTAPVSAIRELMVTVTKLYLFSSAFPIIVMFFAIYFMTYKLTKPLKLMSEASKAMAKGDFSKRIPVTSDDEIGELAVSFNQMTNSLVQLEGMRKSFVANVSHELKTPMTTIGGFIDGILDGTIEPEKQKYYLEIVSQEVKRLSRLVQSMLSISKLEAGKFVLKPELFDFRELLCNIVISQEQRIENKKIEITGLDEIQSISVTADRDLIHQVIYNLVDNSVKFVNEGGNIDFKTNTDGKKLVFSIKNTGKGIPENELPYVFDRFYKVDKSRSANKNSTGLGLYIVKTIVKAHGGTVTVSSRENDFTEFSVTLPLS
ncbi:MAG: HAMP domain-containing protein [Clostridia bacterium]|nr:HAMP domain-containing protein [Clostridia bacterium]